MAPQETTTVEAEPTPVDTGPETTDPGAADTTPVDRGRVRRVLRWTGTVLAGLLVYTALAAPERLSQLTPMAFLRIPLEGLLLAVVLLALGPPTVRTVAVLTVVWTACALVNLQLVPKVKVADNNRAALAYYSALRIPAGIRDRQALRTRRRSTRTATPPATSC